MQLQFAKIVEFKCSLHPGQLPIRVALLLHAHDLLQRAAKHGRAEDRVLGMSNFLYVGLLQPLQRQPSTLCQCGQAPSPLSPDTPARPTPGSPASPVSPRPLPSQSTPTPWPPSQHGGFLLGHLQHRKLQVAPFAL